jgi:predicted membrane protein
MENSLFLIHKTDKAGFPYFLAMSDNFTFVIAFFAIFFGAAILLAIVVFGTQSRNEKNKREHQLALEKIELEKERIKKAIIMIPCQYCGGLIPQASTQCPNCGAKSTK